MSKYINKDHKTVAIIGLGYVGLPLAIEFGKKISTIGFDINIERVRGLQVGHDSTLEIERHDFKEAKYLRFTTCLEDLRDVTVFIVTVPTPIDPHKQPDLKPLLKASESIGSVVKRGDVIIYESTVFPGATEEQCIPIVEKKSGLKYNQDFFAGYSPERINPGDKQHRLTDIKKITSGSTPEVADFVDELYQKIIKAGTYKTSSIKVAEAAKVIENTQRDLNIALVNELAMIFNTMEIDTHEVLQAAGTKWNFLPFKPGLVGGHCIGVDPYYLTYKAQSLGYYPEMILAGRRINDSMGSYVISRLVKIMINKNIKIKGAKVLILGLSFKENCPDLRNTRVIDLIDELNQYSLSPEVYDPWVSRNEALDTYGVSIVELPKKTNYDAIILAVPHRQFCEMDITAIRSFGKDKHVFYDLKSVFSREDSDLRL